MKSFDMTTKCYYIAGLGELFVVLNQTVFHLRLALYYSMEIASLVSLSMGATLLISKHCFAWSHKG